MRPALSILGGECSGVERVCQPGHEILYVMPRLVGSRQRVSPGRGADRALGDALDRAADRSNAAAAGYRSRGISRLLRRSAPRNDPQFCRHCERSEAISFIILMENWHYKSSYVKISHPAMSISPTRFNSSLLSRGAIYVG